MYAVHKCIVKTVKGRRLKISTKNTCMDSFVRGLFVGVLALLVSLSWLSWKRSRASSNSRAPPEPVDAWPILGHLPMFTASQLLHETLGNLADNYGPAFAIRMGLRRALVVSNWEVAKECLVTNDKIFASRPIMTAMKLMGYNNALFGFAPHGPYWREVRRITILELLSNRRLESLKHIWVSEVDTFVKRLYRLCVAKQPTLVEMQKWFSDLTINISVRLVAGNRSEDAGYKLDDEDVRRLQKAVRDFFDLSGRFMMGDAVPFLWWLDLGHERAMKRAAKEFDYLLETWLTEHRQHKLDGRSSGDRSFMDVLLTTLEDKDLFGYKADTVNKATCQNMILGGSDETAVTLTWALSLLLNNPEALKKGQDEIDIHVGQDKQVDQSDIERLAYLQAIVMETLRLYPAVPLSGPREAIEDCTISGYHIRAGTQLIVNLRKIQRDPDIWSNPNDFRPERFLTANANGGMRVQQPGFLPFGSGRRKCPGISLSLQLMHLTLARLLQGFNFETNSNVPVEMTESPGMTNFKEGPLEVVVTPRLPMNLY